MKAQELNKIEPTWFNIEENTIKKCKENNVEYYNYLGSFSRFLLFNYMKSKSLIETIKKLDFSDETGTRAILNKRNLASKQKELELAKESFFEHRKKLFDWLDKTKDPYFFILNPVYQYGSGISYNSWASNRCGYKKEPWTGTRNLSVAIDYLKYKLSL